MIQISVALVSLCFLGFLLLKRTSGREFVNVFFINFVLQFLVLDVVHRYLSGYQSTNDDSYMAAALGMSLAYVLSIWALSEIPSVKRTSRSAFEAVVSGGYPFARYAIFLWLIFRLYLLGRYGLRSFSLLDPFEQGVAQGSPINYAEFILFMSLTSLAGGAVLALVVRLALLGYRGISILEWLLLGVFLGFIMLGEAPLGVRRTVLLYALIFITTYSMSRQNSFKVLSLSIIIAGIGLAFIEYYSQIRDNAQNPEVLRLLSSGDASGIMSGLVAYLTPGTQPATAHSFRSGGLDYLALCIKLVEQSGKIMDGSLMMFSLYKVIPSALYEGKPTIDIDTYVADFFQLEETDYGSSLLANLYVDVGVYSVMLSPILWWSTMYIMLFILSKARTNGPLALSVSGMIFTMLSSVEGSLVALFATFRDIFIILPIFYLVGVVFGKSRPVVRGSGASPVDVKPCL